MLHRSAKPFARLPAHNAQGCNRLHTGQRASPSQRQPQLDITKTCLHYHCLHMSKQLTKSSSSSSSYPPLGLRRRTRVEPTPSAYPHQNGAGDTVQANRAHQFTAAGQDSSHSFLPSRCKTHQSCLKRK